MIHRNSLTSISLLLNVIALTAAFRCQHDKRLENATSTRFRIVPQKDLNGKALWVSRMEFFLFGKIVPEADAKIHAGFYDPKTGFLVYKVIVNCQKKTWKTMYNNNKKKEEAKKWKQGKLEGACPDGDFDLIGVVGCSRDHLEAKDYYDISCAKQAYFIFNGEVLENNIIEDSVYGNRPETLPIHLKKAKLFKGMIKRSGVYFSREAYGKCFAFPTKYHSSCKHAFEWVSSRSERVLGSLGAWDMAYTVKCEWDSDANVYQIVQDAVMPDGSGTYLLGSRGFKTCCCSYRDGYLDNGSCKVNRNNYSCDPTLECDPIRYNTTFSDEQLTFV